MDKMDRVRFFQVKPAIFYGLNAIDELGNHNFKQVCIVTDEGMIKCGLINLLTDTLDKFGIKYHIFSEVRPDPSMDIVKKGLVDIFINRPDALIAFGGGSAIDSAKAVIYYCQNVKKIFVDEQFAVKPYFIAMPTTAGTGSEVTEFSIITDTTQNAKISIIDDTMMPDAAVLEPRLIESVPPHITAATGMDVLCHAVESYVSLNSNPFSRAYSMRAADLVFQSLQECYENGKNLDARAAMQIASCMAGIAFNSADLGIVHSIAHTIGAQWHIPHGLANAIAMPYAIAFNGRDKKVDADYHTLLTAVGGRCDYRESATKALVNMIATLAANMNMPKNLKEHGVPQDEFIAVRDELVDRALNDVLTEANPIKPTRDEMIEIYNTMYDGDPFIS